MNDVAAFVKLCLRLWARKIHYHFIAAENRLMYAECAKMQILRPRGKR
jgi:hypothetical protein